MAGCIHPSCDCKIYQERKNCKGTLLELRLGCKSCGHQAADHRRLTAVDHLLEKELVAATGNKCTQCISMDDVPHSPVFGPHDPISIPFEGVPERGVPCTCKGFQSTSIVQIWQKFRTYSKNDALKSLPQLRCSFCQHSLEKHQKVEKSSALSSTLVSPSVSPKLTLGSSETVWFPPLNRRCVQLVVPNKLADLVMLGIVRSDNGLELAVHTCTGDPEESSAREDKNTCREVESAKGDSQPLNTTSEQCEDMINTTRVPNSSQDKLRINQCTPLCSIAPGVAQPTDQASDSTMVPKGRKRKRSQPAVTTRRTRSASKKQKLEIVSSLDNMSSIESKKLVTNKTGESGACQPETSNVSINSSGPAEQSLKQRVGMFVRSLGKKESFTLHKLPEAVSGATVELMSAAYHSIPLSNRMVLLLALGTVDGQVVICAPLEPGCEVLELQGADSSPTQALISSLSWQEEEVKGVDNTSNASGIRLCAGTSTGTLSLWNVQLEAATRSELHSQPSGHFNNTSAEITVCSWSPDGRYLAAGTLVGQVILYSVDTGVKAEHLQTIHCCGASVTACAWITSSEYTVLAVGGYDDCVQLLCCKLPAKTNSQAPEYSILNYYHRLSENNKFVHTHSFQGHQSFVSDLVFLPLGVPPVLVSLGWDGQLLFWQETAASNHVSAHTKARREQGTTDSTHVSAHTKARRDANLPYLDTEPLGGYMIGPSTHVEFIPIAVCRGLGGGLLVMVIDRQGAVSVINYV